MNSGTTTTSIGDCHLCGQSAVTNRCSQCRSVFYCSKEHQKADWKRHKKHCVVTVGNQSDQITSTRTTSALKCTNQPKRATLETPSETTALVAIKDMLPNTTLQSVTGTGTSAMLSLPSSVESLTQSSLQLEGGLNLHDGQPFDCFRTLPSYKHSFPNYQPNVDLSSMKRDSAEWVRRVCQFVANDMEKYGICVVDNFLGGERGKVILDVVQNMYMSGVFREGETVTSRPTTGSIRGDKTMWVDGTEANCESIAHLISTVDSIIMHTQRVNANSELAQHRICDRTKVFVRKLSNRSNEK